MKDNYTHIGVVLDNSGSMQIISNDTIGGFNGFLQAQKDAEGEATITIYEFGNGSDMMTTFLTGDRIKAAIEPKVRCDFTNIKEVEMLSHDNYRPNGGTPLLDTIGVAIARTGEKLKELPEALRPSKVLFVIITDGEENTSRKYNLKQIKEMITHQKDVYKWEFVFLGANQDAIQEASKMGILAGNSLTYGTTKEALGETYSILANKTANYRASVGDVNALVFSDEERTTAYSGNKQQ